MSTPFVVPKKSGDQHREKLQKKKCAFPGCKENFMGTGKSKYCQEHRLRKYRKVIDSKKIIDKKAEEDSKNPNQNIKHNYSEATIVQMECKLDGCGKEFEIKLFPNVFWYPKYCSEHRNEYKRKRFIEINSNAL